MAKHGREQLESIRLAPWACLRRRDLVGLLDRLISTKASAVSAPTPGCVINRRTSGRFSASRSMACVSSAMVGVIGTLERLGCGKQVASYLGLVPLEKSSGNRRRLGHITKQGSSMLRFLLVEAAQVTVRSDRRWRSKYFHLMMRGGRKIAKVAMARTLAVRLYWMWRKHWDYEHISSVRTQDSPDIAMCALEHRVIDWASCSPARGVRTT
jgi:transposase